jgi:hypothetical protein
MPRSWATCGGNVTAKAERLHSRCSHLACEGSHPASNASTAPQSTASAGRITQASTCFYCCLHCKMASPFIVRMSELCRIRSECLHSQPSVLLPLASSPAKSQDPRSSLQSSVMPSSCLHGHRALTVPTYMCRVGQRLQTACSPFAGLE